MASEGSSESTSTYQRLQAKILKGDCVTGRADHEVVIVGYGFYKGIEVWAVANSWGSNYGVHGFYYVKIGSNAFCHEVNAYTMLSRFYDLENTSFSQSNVFQKNQHIYYNNMP